MKKIILTLMVVTLLTFWPNIVAYSVAEDTVVQDTVVQGKIVQVSPNVITLNPNEAMLAERVSVEINAQTKLENITSLSDLKRDDKVKVHYIEQDGRKIAATIAKIAEAADQSTRG